MKRLMSIAAIALFVAGSSALACDTCGCKAKKAEGKCGGDKAKKGEGSCGGDKASGEGSCGGDKAKKGEGKCGEGKCGG